jgi:hypothetical protein
LDWQQQRLDPQDCGVHESDGVHRMQNQTLHGAYIA